MFTYFLNSINKRFSLDSNENIYIISSDNIIILQLKIMINTIF